MISRFSQIVPVWFSYFSCRSIQCTYIYLTIVFVTASVLLFEINLTVRVVNLIGSEYLHFQNTETLDWKFQLECSIIYV